jgi:hypothetical protein
MDKPIEPEQDGLELTLESNETVKVKITANGLSASTATQEDVSKLDFKEDKIVSSQDLFVNGAKVITNSADFKVKDDGTVVAKDLKADELKAEDLKVTNKMVAKDIKSEVVKAEDLTVTNVVDAKDIRVDDINVDNKIVAKDMEASSIKVDGNDVLVSSSDLSWDPLTGTLTVKNLKVVEHIEVV